MTAIAAVTDGETAWMGADSARMSGWDLIIDPAPKIFRNGPYLMGLSGEPRMAQILQYEFAAPVPDDGADLSRHMCTTFISRLRACLKEHGWAKKDSEREGADGSTFLAAIAGRVFKVYEDYQVSERADGLDACGCGKDYVLGALHASGAIGWGEPSERITQALEAAARFSAGVTGPFVIVQTPDVMPAEIILAGATSTDALRAAHGLPPFSLPPTILQPPPP